MNHYRCRRNPIKGRGNISSDHMPVKEEIVFQYLFQTLLKYFNSQQDGAFLDYHGSEDLSELLQLDTMDRSGD